MGIAWVACQLMMVTTILGFLMLEGTDPTVASAAPSPWRFIIPALVSSTAILPIALLDMLIFTNRFTGPLLRFRKHLQSLAEGQSVSALHFRPGDLLSDLGDHINEIQIVIRKPKPVDASYDNTLGQQIPLTIGGER